MAITVGATVKLGQFSQGVVLNISREPRKCERLDGRKVTAPAVLISFDGARKARWIALRDLED